MRRIIATLAVVAAALAALAGSASADVPNPSVGTYADPGVAYGHSCTTPLQYGYLGQYGAWGYFIDGCTAPPIGCSTARCIVRTDTRIEESPFNGHRTTQNARLRIFSPNGQVRFFHDQSCSGTNRCWTFDAAFMYRGETATVQCNGVREASAVIPISQSLNYCNYRISVNS